MSKAEPAASTPELSYEEARDALVAVVRQLESGNVGLSEAMELWKRGEHLAAICQTWLDGARATIEQSRRSQEGTPAAE